MADYDDCLAYMKSDKTKLIFYNKKSYVSAHLEDETIKKNHLSH